MSELGNTKCSGNNRLFFSVKLLSLLTYRPACLFWLVYSLFNDAAGNSRDLI